MNYYSLMLLSIFITLISQIFVSSCYSKYSKIRNERNISGMQAARYILDKNHLSNVKIEMINGYLTDHYDPKSKTIRLSSSIYNGKSISSVSVACHECGHAIQDREGYIFMNIRSKLIPIVNFSSYAGYISILLGCLFGSYNLIYLGITCEMLILLFQIITLPVEINASKRALNELDYAHFLNSQELKKGRCVLVSAALTYIASVATTLIQILRLLLMFRNRGD